MCYRRFGQTLIDGTDRMFRNFGKEPTRCKIPEEGRHLNISFRERTISCFGVFLMLNVLKPIACSSRTQRRRNLANGIT